MDYHWQNRDYDDKDYDAINGEPTEFEWNIFPGFTTLQLKNELSLSQIGSVSKFCMDTGFTSVVEIGQYFMTKDNGPHLMEI